MAVEASRPVLRPAMSYERALRILILLVLVIFAFIMLLPLLWMVATSFKPEGEIVDFPPELFSANFTLKHYADVWDRIPFARLYMNTVIFAGGVTLASLLFDSLTAYALARLEFPGRTVLFIAIIITLMLPFQVTLIPLFDLLTKLDWVNTFQGLIVPRATNAFGIFFLRQFFLTIPKDLEDAARVDGASEFYIYRKIVLPLSVPALLTLGLFHFMYNWNDLLWPLITTTDLRTLPAGLALFMGEHVVEYGLLMAGSTLALIPVVIFFLAVQRKFIQGIATTGLK